MGTLLASIIFHWMLIGYSVMNRSKRKISYGWQPPKGTHTTDSSKDNNLDQNFCGPFLFLGPFLWNFSSLPPCWLLRCFIQTDAVDFSFKIYHKGLGNPGCPVKSWALLFTYPWNPIERLRNPGSGYGPFCYMDIWILQRS